MTPWARLTLPLATFLLGACSEAPPEVASTADDSAESTTEGPPPPTTSATTPGEDTLGTMGATGMETTMGAVDTTSAVETTTMSDETTMGASTVSSSVGESSTGEPPECVVPDDCPNNQTCVGGDCVDACGGAWGAGSYDYCLDQYGSFATMSLCGASHTCIYDNFPVDVATCSRQGCASACDCPAPPVTGDATVTCGNITSPDANADCYLSCANGETCPDGMACQIVAGSPLYCARPVQPLAMYGNCGDVNAPCANGGTCATSGGASVCVTLCEGVGVGACNPAPPGAAYAPACDTVISPPMGADCHIPCVISNDCPAGMSCINDTGDLLCMWP